MFEHVLAFSHRHSYEMPAEFRLDLEIYVVVGRARRDAEWCGTDDFLERRGLREDEIVERFGHLPPDPLA